MRKNDIIINLQKEDESFDNQGKIFDWLLEKGIVIKPDVVDIGVDRIVINYERLSEPEAKNQLRKLERALRFQGSKLGLDRSNPIVSTFSSDIDSAFSEGGDSSSAPAGGTDNGATAGIGAANLRGTTILPLNSNIERVNIDEIIHDPESFSEGCPYVTYEPGCSYVTMPDQTVYSIGEITFSAVDFLNSELEEKMEMFAAEENENAGSPVEEVSSTNSISVDDPRLYPKHAKSIDDLIARTPKIYDEANRTITDVPVKNLLRGDLKEIVRLGVLAANKESAPRTSRVEVKQKFLSEVEDDQYSVGDWIAKTATKKVVTPVVRKKSLDLMNKGAQNLANSYINKGDNNQ